MDIGSAAFQCLARNGCHVNDQSCYHWERVFVIGSLETKKKKKHSVKCRVGTEFSTCRNKGQQRVTTNEGSLALSE